MFNSDSNFKNISEGSWNSKQEEASNAQALDNVMGYKML